MPPVTQAPWHGRSLDDNTNKKEMNERNEINSRIQKKTTYERPVTPELPSQVLSNDDTI